MLHVRINGGSAAHPNSKCEQSGRQSAPSKQATIQSKRKVHNRLPHVQLQRTASTRPPTGSPKVPWPALSLPSAWHTEVAARAPLFRELARHALVARGVALLPVSARAAGAVAHHRASHAVGACRAVDALVVVFPSARRAVAALRRASDRNLSALALSA